MVVSGRVTLNYQLVQEEIFGPVSLVFRPATLTKPSSCATRLVYGLSATLFTQESADNLVKMAALRPYTCLVAQLDGFVNVAGRKQDGHGAENLLLHERVIHVHASLTTIGRT